MDGLARISTHLLSAYIMSKFVRLGSGINLKLVQVQIYFRHGARTPLHYVKSPLCDADWPKSTTADVPKTMIPFVHIDRDTQQVVDEDTMDLIYKPFVLPGGEAIGMLTSIGQEDLYDLGERLRKDYAKSGLLLSEPPKLSEFQCRSTRVGRNIKSMRCIVAGLTGGQVPETVKVTSIPFEAEFLFPNPRNCGVMDRAFIQGTEELRNNSRISSLKYELKKALKIDRLVDEFEKTKNRQADDCQVYYVRDDYIARKHNKFTYPEALKPLEEEMDLLSATELLCELLGKQRDWMTNLDITIGPVLHLILTKIRDHSEMPPLQLVAGHDSTILPLLLAFGSFDGKWPPFGADVIIELYSQTDGPNAATIMNGAGEGLSPPAYKAPASALPHSSIDWPADLLDNFWVRMKYLNKPAPLVSLWSMEKELQPIGSMEYVPLRSLIERWTPMAVSMEDFRSHCLKAAGRSYFMPDGMGYMGPKPV
uniref:2-phosphoxylose phosphatase 1 n=1 Tax=Schistocephalus solidus TaxID=70667 RepID=A0A0X3PXD2_SCHSO